MIGITQSEEGFTLIELLVVVAIIGILAATAVPQIMSAICNSRVSSLQGDISTIQTAMQQCQMNSACSNPAAISSYASPSPSLLPDRITGTGGATTNGGTWSLNDTNTDGTVDCIDVTGMDSIGGCDGGISGASFTTALSYNIGTGNYAASAC